MYRACFPWAQERLLVLLCGSLLTKLLSHLLPVGLHLVSVLRRLGKLIWRQQTADLQRNLEVFVRELTLQLGELLNRGRQVSFFDIPSG